MILPQPESTVENSLNLSPRLPSKMRSLRNRKRPKAGEAIGSGTYGCVFSPPLYCTNKEKTYDKSKYVSKFMKQQYVSEELDEVRKIKDRLLKSLSQETINKYYILANDSDRCKINVDKTTEHGRKNLKDLETGVSGKKTECSSIYTSVREVKNSPGSFEALNMINGGKSLEEYLKKMPLDLKSLNRINNRLIDLFKNGIIRMNALGVYHCDLKSLNLVIKNRIRIIDWGLSSILDVPGTKKNFRLNRYRIQIKDDMFYGIPFGNVVITSKFDRVRDKYKSKENYIYNLKKKYTESTPSKYFYNLHMFNNLVNKKTLTDIAVESLAIIVFSDMTEEEYFNKVFLKNIDTFAFLQIYIDIYHRLIPKKEKEFIYIKDNIKRIINKYILSNNYAIKPYSVTEIVQDLKTVVIAKKTTKKHEPIEKKPVSSSNICKKLDQEQCNKRDECQYVNGAKRKYCKKKSNKHKQKKKSKSKLKGKQKKASKKKNICNKLSKAECNKQADCKYVDGAKRKYCRTKKNNKK